MSRDAATPISKYLASIDRRHSLLGNGATSNNTTAAVSSTPLATTDNRSLAVALNFNETYFNEDQSLLHVPTPNRSNLSVLSDFGTTLPDRKRRKTFYENDSEKLQRNCDDLERLLRQTQVDLIDTRSAVTTLEHQKKAAETAYKEKLISIEASKSDISNQWKSALEKIKVLEQKVDQLEKKEKDAVDGLHDQKNAHSNMVCSLQNRIMKLQSENCELKQKFDEEGNKSSQAIRKLTNDLDGTERGAEKWIIESQSLRDQLTLVQTQLHKCQEELKESQTRVLKFDEMRTRYEQAEVDSNKSQSMEDTVKKFENLYVNEQIKTRKLAAELEKVKQDNETLRSTMSSEMVLKEQVASLEMRVSYMTGELKEKVASDEINKQLQLEISQWKKVASDLDPRCKTPVGLESFLRQYQNQLLEFKHDISNLKFELQNKTDLLEKFQNESSSLREHVKQFKDQIDKVSLELKKSSKRLILIIKDRDSLKDLKESYEQEFEGRCEKALQERNSHLEKLIAQYEAMLNEDPSKRACDKCEEHNLKIDALASQLDRARQDLTQKTANLEASQSQLSKLESVDSDLSYRIISFGKNPSAMSIQEKLKEVLAENERLKVQLQELSDSSRMDGANVTVVEEKRGLEEKFKNLERKHEILTDSYEYETGQLQTAIERLFGFHIILVREPQSQIRLQSTNSPNPDDMFIFQAADSDWMLLETPVLELFRQEIDSYLLAAGNIPAFLAMVTVKYSQGIPESQYEQLHSSEKTSSSIRPVEQNPVRAQPAQEFEEDDDDGDDREDDNRSEEDDDNGDEEEQDEEEGSENDNSGGEYSDEDDSSGGDDDDDDDDDGSNPAANGNHTPGDYDRDDDDDDEIIMLD